MSRVLKIRPLSTPSFLTLAIAGAFAAGCRSPSKTLVGETRNVTYSVVEQAESCAEAPSRVQEELVELAAWFGVSAPKIRYEYFASLDTLHEFAPCSDSAGGCYSDGVIYSSTRTDTHETVHAIASVVGTPPRCLMEGIAEVFSSNYASEDTSPIPLLQREFDLLSLCTEEGWSSEMSSTREVPYRRVGAFTRFLLDTYGKETFLRLYRTLRKGSASEEVRRDFEGVLKRQMVDVKADWKAWTAFGTEVMIPLRAGYPLIAPSDPPGTIADACGFDAGRHFEHMSEKRSLLRLEGTPGNSFELTNMDGGSASGGLRLSLPESGEILVLLDGPTATFRLKNKALFGDTLLVTLERSPLDATIPLGSTRAIVIGTAPETHAPVCVPVAVRAEEIGTTVKDDVFITGFPTAMFCCVKEACDEKLSWENYLPVVVECPASCVRPSTSFPDAYEFFGPVSSAQANGRKLVYEMQSL